MSEFEKALVHYLHEIAQAQREAVEALVRIEKAITRVADPDQAAREARLKDMKDRSL